MANMREIYLSDYDVQAVQAEYKTKYKQFRPYNFSMDIGEIGIAYTDLMKYQNGQDTDDYAMNEHHKIHRYIKHIKEGSQILFLGTGTGREVACARDKYKLKATGITFGSRNVEFGKDYLGLSDYELREMCVENMPSNWHHQFDAVHGYQIFEHAIAPYLFLSCLKRVMKPGGELFLEWPPGKDYSMGSNPHHQICYTPGQAEALFRKAGFSHVQLMKDNLEPIPESDIWRNDQNYMLCIKGIA